MNPILAEDIMRKRAHRSVIVLVTALACLLFTTDRASAVDGITVVVPVNVTNLHEDVIRFGTWVRFFDSEVSGCCGPPGKILGGRIELRLYTRADDESMQYCPPNEDSLSPKYSHCQESGFLMQTYEAQEGPMSDLVPQ